MYYRRKWGREKYLDQDNFRFKEKKAGKILFSENLKKSEIGYLPQQTVVQKEFSSNCL